MFRLYCAMDAPEAHIVVHMLSEAGIDATVIHENVAGALGELPVSYPEVWIRHQRDEARAREILDAYEVARSTPRAPQHCGECSEENPGTFELCWQCGTVLGDPDREEGAETAT